MKSQMNARALKCISLAVLAVCAATARADDENTPLSLKLSETVIYDTNYARTQDAANEVVSSTAVQLGLNKPYGRQIYSGSARFGIDRHKNYKQQNNQNYDITLGASTGIASNWALSINGNAGENLNPNQENRLADRLEKNVRKHSDGGLKLQYGVQGRWSAIASASTARTSYSLTSSKFQNQDQSAAGFQMVYSPSDLLNFGLGYSAVDSEYPNQIVAGVPEEVRQRSVNLSSNWQVTGFSDLSAVLSFTENKYKSDPNAKFHGVTGSLDWGFTPHGVTSYKLGISRGTDSDNTATGLRTNLTNYLGSGRPLDTSYNTVVTSVNGSAKWVPTAKLNFTAGLVWYQYDVTRTRTVVNSLSDDSTSNYTAFSLSSAYQYSRAIGLGCSLQRYKQTGESNPNVSYGNPRIPYSGNQYSCSASFLID